MIAKELKESRSGLEMRESVQTAMEEIFQEKENLFWKGLKNIGIVPDDIKVEGPKVCLFREGCKRRLPVGVLSSGISVLLSGDQKRNLLPDWPFARQIRYLARKGSRA